MRCSSGTSATGNVRLDNRRIRLTRDYYMSVYEITSGHYKTLTGQPSAQAQKSIYYGGVADEYPVSGYNSQGAIRWDYSADNSYWWPVGGHEGNPNGTSGFNLMRNRFLFAFDLPTEAEWEFACRAGSSRLYYYSDKLPSNPTQADFNKWCWNSSNSSSGPHPVGLQAPNDCGLYDMLGNVAEICLDYFDNTDGWIDRMYVVGGSDSSDAHTDPAGVARPANPIVSGKTQEQTRVKRGGDYSINQSLQQCGSRDFSFGGYVGKAPGMRLVCPAIAVK